jgi:5-methylcytosine-specific restriction endonuclease McrA
VTAFERIAERDGPRCVWCGREPWPRDRTLDHVLPASRGGTRADENLVLACRRCNRDRRSRAAASYARERLRAGARPRLEVLHRAIDRLAASPRAAHRAYAARQAAHLARV